VLQLAGHGDVIAEPELQDVCHRIREEVMVGPRAVGRVIARPFLGPPGRFERTEGRRDFAVPPPGRSYLEELSSRGIPVHAGRQDARPLRRESASPPPPGARRTPPRSAETTRLMRDGLDRGLASRT
jgi:phosphopentomutase